jgi:hypothetical protein
MVVTHQFAGGSSNSVNQVGPQLGGVGAVTPIRSGIAPGRPLPQRTRLVG